jgi:GH15 family glucan-1,4-alpha-glucosidase
MMGPKLSDYALIGNSRAAALVSKTGSLDWCCLPAFDSPSVFAALLDREKGGYFSINPIGAFSSAQRYIPETNVVETLFETQQGEARLLDAFTVMTEEQKAKALFPDHEILRFSGNPVFLLFDHYYIQAPISWKLMKMGGQAQWLLTRNWYFIRT